MIIINIYDAPTNIKDITFGFKNLNLFVLQASIRRVGAFV